MFRGLPNTNERDFSEWVTNLGYEPFSYVGGISPRNEVEPHVAEGALDENTVSIEPHNEMAYSTRFPKVLALKFILYSFMGFLCCIHLSLSAVPGVAWGEGSQFRLDDYLHPDIVMVVAKGDGREVGFQNGGYFSRLLNAKN